MFECVYLDSNPSSCYSKFINIVKSQLTANTIFIPQKQKINPWITKGIVASIKIRNKLIKKKNPLGKFYKSKIKHYIKILRENYFKQQILANNSNPKIQWELLYNYLNISKNKIDFEGDLNKINSYFVNIGQKLANNNNIKPKLIKSSMHSIFLEPITAQEILNKITLLKNNTATGPDSISVKFLKKHKNTICEPLTYIFNLFLEKAYIPPEIKHSIIIPVYKNEGDKTDPTNFRPISLISNIAKLFEKCIHTRVYNFLTKYEMLSHNQFGFRQGKSTEDAIIKLISNLKQGKKHKLVIFLDLKKAFDTVNHTLLLDKLEKLGIRGNALKLFKSYIINRTCCTKIKNKLSKRLTIKCGVSQGTCLAPLLFNIYINNITHLELNGELILFADDAALLLEAKSSTELYNKANADLLEIGNWLMENKLTLNISKTEYIDFSHTIDKNSNIIFRNNIIKPVPTFNYLGCIIDKKLSWEPHINKVTEKITSCLNAFNVTSDPSFKKSVYSALIQSHLQYGLSIWGSGSMECLIELQKRIINKYKLENIILLEDLYRKSLERKINNSWIYNYLKDPFKQYFPLKQLILRNYLFL